LKLGDKMVVFGENIEEPDWNLGAKFIVMRGGEVIKRLLEHRHEETFREEVSAVRQDCLIPQDYFFNCLSEVVEVMSQGDLVVYLHGDEKPVTGLFFTILEVLMHLVENGFESYLFQRFNAPENRKKIAEAYYKIEPNKLRLVVG
jgi:hypothetical protein